jgi:citrate lyase subunit beta/citryl-CoA lyase
MTNALVMRSMYAVPMDQPKRLEEGLASGADALMADLTDLVAEHRKDEARASLRELLAAESSTPIWARVARTHESESVLSDLDVAVTPFVVGLVIPECESPDEIRQFDEWLSRLEREREIPEGQVKLLPLPESALAIRNYYETLTASPRVIAAWFPGAAGGDLSRDLGYQWSEEGSERVYARSKVLLDARAAGIDNILDSGSGRNDIDAFERETLISRRFGFNGRFTYNTGQVEIANPLFAPTPEEVEAAKREVEAYHAALEEGLGLFELDGRVVDVTTVKYAERTLERAAAAGV